MTVFVQVGFVGNPTYKPTEWTPWHDAGDSTPGEIAAMAARKFAREAGCLNDHGEGRRFEVFYYTDSDPTFPNGLPRACTRAVFEVIDANASHVKSLPCFYQRYEAPNLFGRRTVDGVEETRRLLALLVAGNNFKIVHLNIGGAVVLEAPFEYQARRNQCRPWVSISDNGGEMNVEWIGHDASMISIPSTWFGSNCNAETMHYRIVSVLEGTPLHDLDFNRIEEPLDLSVYGPVAGLEPYV